MAPVSFVGYVKPATIPIASPEQRFNEDDVKHSNSTVISPRRSPRLCPGDYHASCPPLRRDRLEDSGEVYSLLYPWVSLLLLFFTFESVPSRITRRSARAPACTQNFRGTCHFAQVPFRSPNLIDLSERMFKATIYPRLKLSRMVSSPTSLSPVKDATHTETTTKISWSKSLTKPPHGRVIKSRR